MAFLKLFLSYYNTSMVIIIVFDYTLYFSVLSLIQNVSFLNIETQLFFMDILDVAIRSHI